MLNTVQPIDCPAYLGECPRHLKRSDVRIIRVNSYGTAPSIDAEVTPAGGKRAIVYMHRVVRNGTAVWAVVTLGGSRDWRYLAADGWVDAIAESDPRASVHFAMTRAELTFECPWEAINAAATSVVSRAPTHPFRSEVSIRDEWGTMIPYGK